MLLWKHLFNEELIREIDLISVHSDFHHRGEMWGIGINLWESTSQNRKDHMHCLSTSFYFYFGTVQTVCYFLFCISIVEH